MDPKSIEFGRLQQCFHLEHPFQAKLYVMNTSRFRKHHSLIIIIGKLDFSELKTLCYSYIQT